MTWREYCEECGYSIGGIKTKQMAEHLMRIHNRSGSCPVNGAIVEEEPETAETAAEIDMNTVSDTDTNNAQ